MPLLKKPLRILVTGATGQVGDKLFTTLAPYGEVVATASPRHQDPRFRPLDLADRDAIAAVVRDVRPHVIVNPAAYTAVDKAESEEALAARINGEAPGILASEAKKLDAALVHFSTDYVYPGDGDTPRTETAPVAPPNAYGRTKLAGERAIQEVGGRYVILRTSWVFSDHGANFVKTMLRLGADREALRVVADQIGAPTSAAFLARMTARVLDKGLELGDLAPVSGIYHLACAGTTSWADFAEEIFRQTRALGRPLAVRTVEKIPTEAYPTPAARPKNSRLDCTKFRTTFGVAALQPWQEALAETLKALGS